MNDLKLTIIQTNLAWENKKQNLENFTNLINEIDDNSEVVILPEMFSTGFSMKAKELAENFDGDTVKWMKKTASEKNITLIGSIIINVRDKFYNRLLVVYPDNKIEYYDKRHLFRMLNEHYTYTPGKQKLISDISGWKVRPLICYDLRFPIWSRNENDYDILVYVANWPESRRETWLTLLMARAIENQCYVVGVNRIGIDGNAINFSGDSVIIDAKGTIISETKPYKESVETLTLSMDDLTRVRQKFPANLDADKFNIIF